MVLKDYASCLKDKFKAAQKGDRAAAFDVMKALSLKLYIFTMHFHEWQRGD